MKICGFNKTTLLDYPGRVACTIFLGGCNFRCPFCQNGALVVEPDTQPEYSQEEILAFLKKERGFSMASVFPAVNPHLHRSCRNFSAESKRLAMM